MAIMTLMGPAAVLSTWVPMVINQTQCSILWLWMLRIQITLWQQKMSIKRQTQIQTVWSGKDLTLIRSQISLKAICKTFRIMCHSLTRVLWMPLAKIFQVQTRDPQVLVMQELGINHLFRPQSQVNSRWDNFKSIHPFNSWITHLVSRENKVAPVKREVLVELVLKIKISRQGVGRERVWPQHRIQGLEVASIIARHAWRVLSQLIKARRMDLAFSNLRS